MIDAIGIVVEDMARSLAFYRKLGLDIPQEADTEPHVSYALPGGFTMLWDTYDTIRSFDPSFVPPANGQGGMGLAFRCATPGEVDRLHATMTDAGYEDKHKPWDAFWGQRYATVIDPDGNGVDLYAPIAAQ